jgi:hypothetical protein
MRRYRDVASLGRVIAAPREDRHAGAQQPECRFGMLRRRWIDRGRLDCS